MTAPNIGDVHSHDTGRWLQPYGSELNDTKHWAHTLRRAGYRSVLIGDLVEDPEHAEPPRGAWLGDVDQRSADDPMREVPA